MTVIEFFEKTAIENMLSALLCQPERVIYIGDSTKQMKRSIECYKEVLRGRDIDVDMQYRSVPKNRLQEIVTELDKLVEQYDDCVFNLDGGEDLYLVAVGIITQRHPGVQLHRFNVRNNTIIDCDADGNDQLKSPVEISAVENVRIYGGRILFEDERPGTTHSWDFTEDFCRDILNMWEICREDPSEWNFKLGLLDRVNTLSQEEDPLKIRIDMDKAEIVLADERDCITMLTILLGQMADAGLIRDLALQGKFLSYRYKNAQVRRSLSKAGQILELLIAAVARILQDKDGNLVYHDVQTGVYLDWDGVSAAYGQVEVNNEIDVLLMKGAVPVFISCKNGSVTIEELFKLHTVAHRFGAKYAKKVLVASQLDKMGAKAKHIRARAADMGIRILEDVDNMSMDELCAAVRNLWSK